MRGLMCSRPSNRALIHTHRHSIQETTAMKSRYNFDLNPNYPCQGTKRYIVYRVDANGERQVISQVSRRFNAKRLVDDLRAAESCEWIPAYRVVNDWLLDYGNILTNIQTYRYMICTLSKAIDNAEALIDIVKPTLP